MADKRATPHGGNRNGVKSSCLGRHGLIIPRDEWERGTLAVGLSTALMFGLCLMHWAVVA